MHQVMALHLLIGFCLFLQISATLSLGGRLALFSCHVLGGCVPAGGAAAG